MTIRDAKAADLPHIVEIYNASIPGRFATADTRPIEVASRILWMREHSPGRHPLWVATSQPTLATSDEFSEGGTSSIPALSANSPERIEGWLSFQPFSDRPAYGATAELSVYVAPASCRSGIGRQLLQRAVERAPALGLKTLLALIFGHNEASLRLFASLEFKEWGLLPRVTELDGVERDVVLLGRRVVK